MAVVQYFLQFCTFPGIDFCNVECQMLNGERNFIDDRTCGGAVIHFMGGRCAV